MWLLNKVLYYFRKNSYTTQEIVQLSDIMSISDKRRNLDIMLLLLMCINQLVKQGESSDYSYRVLSTFIGKTVSISIVQRIRLWRALFLESLNKMPLYVNDSNETLRAISIWRLKIGR